jgi:tRNA pseudouridine13 synthase
MIVHANPQKAFIQLPLSIRRFFVDAYRSYIFNLTLSRAYQEGEALFEPQNGDVCYDKNVTLGKFEMDPQQKLAIPIVGYSYFKKTRFENVIKEILGDEEVSSKDFYFKEMQELSSEGGFRTAAVVCTDFVAGKDTVEFTLSRGSFATIVLREILKPQDPFRAGF